MEERRKVKSRGNGRNKEVDKSVSARRDSSEGCKIPEYIRMYTTVTIQPDGELVHCTYCRELVTNGRIQYLLPFVTIQYISPAATTTQCALPRRSAPLSKG